MKNSFLSIGAGRYCTIHVCLKYSLIKIIRSHIKKCLETVQMFQNVSTVFFFILPLERVAVKKIHWNYKYFENTKQCQMGDRHRRTLLHQKMTFFSV